MQRLEVIRWLKFLILLASSAPSLAAEVVDIDLENMAIIINEGTNSKFFKKSKVCFYNENFVRVGCSLVSQERPKISFIQIKSDQLLGKIRLGMLARLEASPRLKPLLPRDLVTPGSAAPSSSAAAAAAPAAPASSAASTDLAPASGSKESKNTVMALALAPLVQPIAYENLFYDSPLGLPADSMWKSDSPAQAKFSAGAELGFGIGSYRLALGLRTRLFASQTTTADYKDADGNGEFEQYMEATILARSTGGWLDFFWWNPSLAKLNLHLGNGLDFDRSQLRFSAAKKTDGSDDREELYVGKSSQSAIALRAVFTLEYGVGPVNLAAGLVTTYPILQAANFSIDKAEDPFLSSLPAKKLPEQDLEAALRHRAKPGVEFMLAAGFLY